MAYAWAWHRPVGLRRPPTLGDGDLSLVGTGMQAVRVASAMPSRLGKGSVRSPWRVLDLLVHAGGGHFAPP